MKRKILNIVLIVILIIGLTGCDKNKKDDVKIEQTQYLITGKWKEQEISDNKLRDKYIDGFIDIWYKEELYHSENDLKDIKIFKKADDEKYIYFLMSAKMHIKEAYKNDGTPGYNISNAEGSVLDDVFVLGVLYEEDGKTRNNEYTCGAFYTYVNKDYNDVFNYMLKYVKTSEEDLICLNSNNFYNELKDAIINNDNIYSKMEALLKQGKLDDAKNLYYKNTQITKGQSEKCLILYLKYYYINYSESLTKETNKSVSIQSCNASSRFNTDTEEKNDYVITVNMRYNGYDLTGKRVNRDTSHIFYVNIDVDKKEHEMTKNVW